METMSPSANKPKILVKAICEGPLAGLPSHLLLVALCGIRCHSLEIPDCPHVQVSPTGVLAEEYSI